MSELAGQPRRIRAKPPPLDLSTFPLNSALASNRIPLWNALRVAPEATSPGTPSPCDENVSSRGAGLSAVTWGLNEGGWANLPAHLLELILAKLRDSQGRWPSRKVLFSVCGVCKLWRRVGHTLFFSNVWNNHADVIVHPSQLFTLCPHPLRLQSSDHLLRCFVQRTPCPSAGLSPRFGRLWRFALYLGGDHRGLRGLAAGSHSSGQQPQLLMCAQQTNRRCYQLLLSPALGTGPGPGPGGGGGGGGDGNGSGGWCSPHSHSLGGGGHVSAHDSGLVAVLRSNVRCSHYELLPASSCPWARRLIAVAGYIPPLSGPPMPLIRLEYRLRVRGIMLPRRMKVQVPVPHSLQRVVHNPLYDLHEPVAESPSPTGAAWAIAAAGGGAGPAVMAPPLAAAPGPAPGGGAAAGGGAGPAGGGGLGDGGEGLMDNLEDILEAAMRTEPLLFANMVDAAAVRPADDDEGGTGGGAAAGGAGASGAGGGVAGGRAGSRIFRSGSSNGVLGGLLQRGFLQHRRNGLGGAGGSVQWWGPASPGRSGGADGGGGGGAAAAATEGGGTDGGAAGGWSASTPLPTPLVRLQNKAPHWNDALMCWCLNFRGRVKMASVKNFQLMCSADTAGRCVMQFGKVEDGIYILDFNPCVLTAAQAFAAALSTFETKYLL